MIYKLKLGYNCKIGHRKSRSAFTCVCCQWEPKEHEAETQGHSHAKPQQQETVTQGTKLYLKTGILKGIGAIDHLLPKKVLFVLSFGASQTGLTARLRGEYNAVEITVESRLTPCSFAGRAQCYCLTTAVPAGPTPSRGPQTTVRT